jgi:hypothetical protein
MTPMADRLTQLQSRGGLRAPCTTKEATGAVLASRGIKDTTDKQRLDPQAGIRSSLENNVGKTVERVGEGVPKRWKLAQ